MSRPGYVKSTLLLFAVLLLGGCTVTPIGGLSYDAEGKAYSRTIISTEYNTACVGSCLEEHKTTK